MTTPPSTPARELAEKCAKKIDELLWTHFNFMGSGTVREFTAVIEQELFLTSLIAAQQQADGQAHDLKFIRKALDCDGSDLEQLVDKIKALIADKQRLDSWNPLWRIARSEFSWQVFYNGRRIGEGSTLRQAIDSAIQQQEKRE